MFEYMYTLTLEYVYIDPWTYWSLNNTNPFKQIFFFFSKNTFYNIGWSMVNWVCRFCSSWRSRGPVVKFQVDFPPRGVWVPLTHPHNPQPMLFKSKFHVQDVRGCLLLSHVWLFVIPWTITHQATLPMEFSRQEYLNGLPCLPPGDLPNPGLLHCRQILYCLSHQGVSFSFCLSDGTLTYKGIRKPFLIKKCFMFNL